VAHKNRPNTKIERIYNHITPKYTHKHVKILRKFSKIKINLRIVVKAFQVKICSVTGTLKPRMSNIPYLDNNIVIGTLTADGWAVTFGTVRRGLGGLRSRPLALQVPPRCTKCYGPPVNGQYTN